MKTFSALYCTETKQVVDAKVDGSAVCSPRNTSELEFWEDNGVWMCITYESSLYKDIPKALVPDVVLLSKTLLT